MGGRLRRRDREGRVLILRTHRRRLGGGLVVALSTALALAVLPALPAGADPADDLRDANRAAQQLREHVDQLELQAAQAAEDRAAAAEQLAQVISQEISADAALGQARDAGDRRRAEATRRARALYMAGGNTGMLAGVLSGRDLGDVLTGLRTVRTLVGSDVAATSAADRDVDQAVAGASRVQALRGQRQLLEAATDTAARQLATALDQQRALLSEADATVLALAEEQRRAEEAAALAQAASSIARLGVRPDVPAPNAQAEQAVLAATSMLGRAYEWGAVGPDRFDCSGLTSWAYRQAGVAIPRTSRAQYAGLPRVPLDALAPGDLIFFSSGPDPATIHHVGMYLGDGRMVHAPRTGDVVKISAVWSTGVIGAARPTARG